MRNLSFISIRLPHIYHYASEALKPIIEILIEILLLIGKPESHLLHLLNLICENFPPYTTELELSDHVKVACPCQEVHVVSPFGFKLLRKVERRTETRCQQVVLIRMLSIQSWVQLPALNSRISRQGAEIVSNWFAFYDQEDVEAFLNLAKIAENISFQRLVILILIRIIILMIFSSGWTSEVPLENKAGQCLHRP